MLGYSLIRSKEGVGGVDGMARLMLSNREQGGYEYCFEPVTSDSLAVAIEKFLRRYGYIRRYRVNPLDRLVKTKILTGEYGGDGRELLRKTRSLCIEKCSVEGKGFYTSVEEAKEPITKAIEEAIECLEKCIEEAKK